MGTRPTNVFVELSAPPWRLGSYGGFVITASEPLEYTHTIEIGGGYRSARFSLALKDYVRDYLIEYGVGLAVKVTTGGGVVIWRGYVDTIDAKLGATNYTVGPLRDIANRVKVTYSTRRWDTNPPIGGNQQETGWAEDTLSQQLFGLQEIVLSGGEGDVGMMEALRDNYLRDNAFPKKAPKITPFSEEGSGAAVVINCIGAIDLLDKVTYSDTTDNVDTAIEALILAILQADPNDIFSIVEMFLEDSGITLPSYKDQYDFETLLSLIKDALSYGSNTERFFIGVFSEGNALRYQKIPSDVAYIWDSRSGRLTTPGGAMVVPATVQPGVWIVVADALPHAPMPANGIENLRRSPVAFFVESVTYTAPWGIDFETATLAGLTQTLNDKGLGGRW